MNELVQLVALAPLLLLVGAFINGIFGKSLKEPLPGIIASIMVGASFLLSFLAFLVLWISPVQSVQLTLWPYLQAGNFSLELGFMIDSLSITMMLVITGVGLLIHLYSIGYMHGDPGFSRYFAQLNLFVAAMALLVLGDSFLLIFLGWEGVGVCSYLLIGFWYGEKANADAARKAFIVNRIGDVGFLLAMFLIVASFGTLNIYDVNQAANALPVATGVLTAIALLLLLAACGKSAQLPLQVWLPDAMAGPTPVSALIHAATMVTAGVYLIARAAPIFAQAPAASAVVAWVGTLTALSAAFVAFSQRDIKKILAYSTVSQLGYMFAAVGVGAYWAGVFHLFTHAFFKGLLFLVAGSVIHALGGEQDIDKMGGLAKRLPVTSTTALIATLAIAGVPLLAGFFSKDAILTHVLTSQLVSGYGRGLLYSLLLLTAAMTAFYMFRWYYRVFSGSERLSAEARAGLHESPSIMTTPLLVLAFFAIFAGYLGLPEFIAPSWFAAWLEPSIAGQVYFMHVPAAMEWALIGLSVMAVALGWGLAYMMYERQAAGLQSWHRQGLGARLNRASQAALGFDAAYARALIRPGELLAAAGSYVDVAWLDRSLRQAVTSLRYPARLIQQLQSGFARAYALAMLLGLAFLLLLIAFSGGVA